MGKLAKFISKYVPIVVMNTKIASYNYFIMQERKKVFASVHTVYKIEQIMCSHMFLCFYWHYFCLKAII